MAVVSSLSLSFNSVIRGFHVYKDVWEPQTDEILICVRESANLHDPFAVAVTKGPMVVGHIPRRISALCSLFLHRNGCITCHVTGSRQHSKDLLQGGLEIPCVLTFDTGDKDLISKIRKLLITTENFKIGDEPVIAETEIKSVETTGDSSKKRRIEIDCESYVPLNDDDEIWVCIEGIVLYMSDMNRLSGGLELPEAIINSAQKSLKSQYPTLQGLGLTFEDQPCIDWVDNYIKIAHYRGNHWIAISTIGCDINKIHVYDSPYSNVDTNTEHNQFLHLMSVSHCHQSKNNWD